MSIRKLLAVGVATISIFSAVPVQAQVTKADVVESTYFQRVQYGAVFHSVNSLGVWFWSARSAQDAVAICQMNTPYGATCWYKGYY